MKYLLLLFILVSCQSTTPTNYNEQHPKEPQVSATFMPKDEVVKQMSEFKISDIQEESLDDKAMERQKNLIPKGQLVSNRTVFQGRGLKMSSIGGEPPPDEIDLRARDSSVKSQDDGKCSAYGGVAAMVNAYNKTKVTPGLELSEWNAWALYRQYSCEAFIAALSTNRIGDEKDYPQYGKALPSLRPYIKLGKVKYIGNDTNAMVASLAIGNPVYLAISTPRDMLQCKKVVSPFTAAENGGHALLISGYYMDDKVVGRTVAIIKNSWGKDCGDHGYQYVPLGHLCTRSDYYCAMWSIESVDVITPATPTIPSKPTDPIKIICTRLWYAPWIRTCHQL